ncbi:hypothetical protein FQR65_LT02927 [Abscondita terminalis]|nr:hypothetical protein FQR65_LT02927 [Abscondita terminalis]
MAKTLILIIDLDTITCWSYEKQDKFLRSFDIKKKSVVTDLDRKQISRTNANDFSYNKRSPSGIMYFAIASPPSGQTFSRAFNKTLTNFTQTYLMSRFETASYNITIDTLTIDLPENGSFSSSLLEHICEQFEGKHVIAVLVIGDSSAAFTVSTTAKHVGIPVLWAKGHAQVLQGFRELVSSNYLYVIVLF